MTVRQVEDKVHVRKNVLYNMKQSLICITDVPTAFVALRLSSPDVKYTPSCKSKIVL
jgi:hypothetical protein